MTNKTLFHYKSCFFVRSNNTREVDFVPDEFNSLGTKLAGRAGVQLIPVAIKTDFWGNGKFIKELGPIDADKTIYMTFGKPMHIQGTGKEEHKKIVEFISGKMEEWRNKEESKK